MNKKQNIFLTEGQKIVTMTYEEYVYQYGSDETTSPLGVTPRLHIRHVGFEPTMYQIWSWGIGGNHPRYYGETFNTQEEAEHYLFERKEDYMLENVCTPAYFNTYEEAAADLAEVTGKTTAVITRYLGIVRMIEVRQAEQRASDERHRAIRNKWLETAAPAEANKIAIDDSFRSDVQAAYKLSSRAKSEALAAATSSLLERIGYTITTDFWKVSRILIEKVNK